jgi:hypothetical protein
MQAITLVHATPGKFAKRKVEASNVAALRDLAAEMAARPAADVKLLWRGQILQDSFQLHTINNGLVTIGDHFFCFIEPYITGIDTNISTCSEKRRRLKAGYPVRPDTGFV